MTARTRLGQAPLGDVGGMCAEHGVLVHRLASLQRQITDLVALHNDEVARLHRCLMRLSTRWMLAVTRRAWGLEAGGAPGAYRPMVTPAVAAAAAQAMICRTGCLMDGAHWRDGDQCRLSGQVCTDVVDSGESALPERR